MCYICVLQCYDTHDEAVKAEMMDTCTLHLALTIPPVSLHATSVLCPSFLGLEREGGEEERLPHCRTPFIFFITLARKKKPQKLTCGGSTNCEHGVINSTRVRHESGKHPHHFP